ncbi:pilus assembly protein [Dyella sp. 2RAB6]|uniref:pilus assembly protein n=1 Tax=Dyella sp. 2RAB6 TaxID=3232992 RepID=UPI003F8F0C3A
MPLAIAQNAAPAAVTELSPTPPNLTQGVAPNIAVTFDNSGSMSWNYMGDMRPFDDQRWSGPWQCAGVIDPRVSSATDIRSRTMNGVYYNPNVLYLPPIGADGTAFPDADAGGDLTRVPVEGTAIHRPRNPVALDARSEFRGNPNSPTMRSPSWETRSAAHLAGAYEPARPGRPAHDYRWGCGNRQASPMDGRTIGPDGRAYPNGGPYYYRYRSSAPSIAVDAYGNPTGAGRGNLYSGANWEAVAIRNRNVIIDGVTVNEWKNFANWYAYYRTRILMTRTVMSRVFAKLGAPATGGGYGSPFRVTWQNLYTDDTFRLQDSAIISTLMDANSPACVAANVNPVVLGLQAGTVKTPPNCYRSAFFNWIFEVMPKGGTPLRASTIRAGTFFQRGRGNTGATGDLHDPYWEPPAKPGADGLELTCRQNFHMMVTDGYWNGANPSPLPAPFKDSQSPHTLPDGVRYSSYAAESRVFWDVQGSKYTSSLANIAFHYWATNLRPDLYDPAKGKLVPPYMPDKSVGVVPGAATPALEQYFNPKNDPANWPHLVQYMVTLGIAGKLNFSDDANCTVAASNDLCALRRGSTNATGAAGWTRPEGDLPAAVDDTWHAAINGRGAYFSAANPQLLVDQLSSILTSISARAVPANTGAVNSAVLVAGALGFNAGYSSADWSGSLQAMALTARGEIAAMAWDAGAILDKMDPAKRHILTAVRHADGSFKGGVAFKHFGELDRDAQASLGGHPASAQDTGQARLDYLRGERSKENNTFRARNHLLGAIIGSQAVYVSYPSSSYRNSWPAGSPEQAAVAGDASDCATKKPLTCHTYEAFVQNNLSRKPVAYVGANDGMLHAFDASLITDSNGNVTPAIGAGQELFAYVPRTAYANLGNFTVKNGFKFMPTVDGVPVTRDVYFSQATATPVSTSQGWRTLLVGGLRLGGRGVYALDITDPGAMGAGKVLWEFNADAPNQAAWTDGSISNPGGKASNLGYTYGQPNIGRLNTGKWVVLVPGGYFPDCTKAPFTGANCSAPAAAFNTYSSLFVLDAQTGKLIRELKTPDANHGGADSHGLATPVLGDYNDDQVDDVAFAGDLDGNLWRYDLTSSDPNHWAVTLAFKPDTAAAQPITSMPRLFADPVTNKFIVVFGTGKYLGVGDNTSGSAATQSVYGIRDIGATVTRSALMAQTLTEATADDGKTIARGLTDAAVPSSKQGWYFDLGPSTSSAGERVVVRPGALFDTGRAVIQTLIPGTNDPCNASIQGALMVVNAATGGANGGLSAPGVSAWNGAGKYVVGGRVNDPRTTGTVPLVTAVGGGSVLVPGLKLTGSNHVLNINDALWRRRSWRQIIR